jgi:hypothetical protein
VKRHSYRQYVIEFFLVFAAIVLGFFAENLREYFADQAREKEFVQSLVENLKADASMYSKRDSAMRERIVWMDTLMSILTGKQENRNAEAYLLGRYATRLIQTKPGLSTLNFLAKSNDYASIEDPAVKGKIQHYESDLHWLQEITNVEEQMAEALWPIIPTLFDTKIFTKMKQVGNQYSRFEMPPGNPPLLTNKPVEINQFTYHLYLRRSQFFSEVTNQERMNQERRELIDFLNSKYKLI